MTKESLKKALTLAALRALAGTTIYQRGESYQADGAVGDLHLIKDRLTGTVHGTDDYHVMLWQEDSDLHYECSCPMGEGGDCCKHVVALGLHWLLQPAAHKQHAQQDWQQIQQFLAAQEKDTLVSLLLNQCQQHPALHAELQSKAHVTQAVPDIKALKKIVSSVLGSSHFISYDRMRELVKKAESLLELLGQLLTNQHPAVAAELADHALLLGIKKYMNSDDSSGNFGEFLRQLSDLHLLAYQHAGKNRPLTAKQFLKLCEQDDWNFFAFADYAPLFSPQEYKKYREVVEKAWQQVPTFTPTGKRQMDSWHFHHETSRMEELAKYENDVDALVSILSHNLGNPYQFLRIAEILQQAQRPAAALEWAERGIASFKDDYDGRLVEYLISAYQQANRQQDAIDLLVGYFKQQPTPETFQKLQTIIQTKQAWSTLRKELLAELERRALDHKRSTVQDWRYNAGFLLIDIYLWEKNPVAALQVANVHGAGERQWLQLAGACEEQLPQEAIRIYQVRMQDIVNKRNNQAYAEAAALVGRVRPLMQKTRQTQLFNAWLQELRTTHKPKRNFMQLLDAIVPFPTPVKNSGRAREWIPPQ